MFVLALLALVVSVLALVVSILTWRNGSRSATAAESSAAAARTSAEQAVTSADAAQRSAAAAEEQLARDQTDRDNAARARQVEAHTPKFRMGPIDWRVHTLARSASVYMTSSHPPLERVEVSVMGATDLGAVGSAVTGAPSVVWERPAPAEPYAVRFSRADRSVPVILRLSCTLTSRDDDEVCVVDLLAQEGAESTPAR